MYKRAVSHTLKIQFKKECYCNSTEEKGQSNIVCRTFFKYGRDYWKQMQILSWSKNVLKKIQNIPIINSIKSLEKNAKMKTEKKKKDKNKLKEGRTQRKNYNTSSPICGTNGHRRGTVSVIHAEGSHSSSVKPFSARTPTASL